MAYASSIQTVTDANGTVHAFLENDGLLWQCEWNAQAQRWDQAQVVPGAYGGEKLQVLLVEDLWPTSGKVGNHAGNTPGIVLAYLIGTGEAAKVYATLGSWGSNGQLEWNAPLLLSDSGTVTEAIGLRASGDGGFELVSQRREPVAVDPGNTLQTVSGARSDSELIKQSFSVSGINATEYQLTNKTASIQTPQDVIPTSEPTPVAPASATAGSTQFSRADLLLAPPLLAASSQLLASQPLALADAQPGPLSATASGSATGWNGGLAVRFSNDSNGGNSKTVLGIPLAQFKMRWSLQIPQSSPPMDWSVSGTTGKTDPWAVRAKKADALVSYEGQWNKIGRGKKTLALQGFFGLAGYGSASVVNSFGISFIYESKKESGYKSPDGTNGLGLALKLRNADKTFNIGLTQNRNYVTTAINYQTVYKYDTLSVGQWRGANQLKSISSKVVVSIGDEFQQRRRFSTGGYLQWSIGGSVGYSAQKKYELKGTDGKSLPLPQFLKRWGLSAAAIGTLEGFAFQDVLAVKNGIDRINALSNTDGPSGFNDKPGASRSSQFWIIQGLNAAYGVATSLSPPIWAGVANLPKGGFNEGLNVKGLANGRFLWKGVWGAYVNINDDFTIDFGNKNAFGTYTKSSWQNKFSIDAGAAFPFGVNVPILSYQLTSPKDVAPKSAQADPAAPTNTGSATQQTTLLAAANTPQINSLDFVYLPASGSTLLPNPDNSAALPLVGGSVAQLQVFSLLEYARGLVVSSSMATGSTPVVLTNAGSGLQPGDHTNVPVMGLLVPGSAPTSLNFTVLGTGVIDPNSVEINASSPGAGQYLQLPQTFESSGTYALIPDVFSTGILPKPNYSASGTGTLSTLLSQLPLITVHTSRPGSPLSTPKPIGAIQQAIPLESIANQPVPLYPNATPSDNSLVSYRNVAIAISDPTISLLNQSTATVGLSNGTIVKVVLDQPLYITTSTGITPTKLDLTLDLQSVLGNSVVNPTFSVVPQNLGINNVVEDQAYRANPGFPANSSQPASTTSSLAQAQAVWLEDGINSQLQLTPSQANWPVFNRVVVQSSGGSLTYLNSSTTGSDGVVTQSTTDPSKVTLKALYDDLTDPLKFGAVPSFSAASTPTVITLSGTTSPDSTKPKFAGASAVFWVEASGPVVPQLTSDGNQNYQAYLTALYGQQRINYRIFDANAQQPSWSKPNTVDLYAPTNAVIRHLQAFNVELNGGISTLLVWDETSIDTIKDTPPKPIAIQGWISGTTLSLGGSTSALRIGDLITGAGVEKGTIITASLAPFDPKTGNATYRISRSQVVGSSTVPAALNAIPLLPPTVLKAGFINPNAANLQWSTLFTDANGNSTISTIPWDQSNDIGLGIESISVASQQVIDTSGRVTDTAVLSWSEDVRTPYVQSVLNDEPLIYLQFANLRPGFNDINIGRTASSTTTGTVASSTGLNFTVASALPKSSASAVQNVDGTGVLSTGTGSQNTLYTQVLNSTPVNQLPSSPFGQLTGSIAGITLTVTALSGNLAEGDLLTGPGLLPNTQITAVLSGFDSATGTGTYTINQSQSLSSRNLEALPNPAPSSGKDLGLPFSSFTGSINGTTLSISQLDGSLEVGDGIYGQGVAPGTTITEVLSGFDPTTGSGSYTLNQSATVPASALIATPSSSVPYTIEFWTKLLPGSNADQGAGLVAFGQPSEQAVGAAIPPKGWLMTAGFSVERISYQLAASLGFQEAYDKLNAQTDPAQPGDLFAWGWSLDATGANTTALGGDGGKNLYSNALSLTNLFSGQTLAGVDAFLANYQLKAADLVGGDGLFANTIDLVPGTSLDFNNFLDPNTGLPVSNLNAVSIDTASAQLNSGLVQTINANGDLSSNPATNSNLQTMFQALWNYQEQYGEAKVGFTLDPIATPKPDVGFEQYGGFELDFSIAPGPAISVNKQGQLVFDVADGISITSSGTDPSNSREIPLPSDLRDGEWHYVVATYLPDFRQYSINGAANQVPINRGTASLYVDNQLVASRSDVTDAYIASNINDNALLLANNAGGSIDQFALYNKALLPAPELVANPNGAWPEPSKSDVLAILKQLGYPATDQTPNPGAIESALTEHWRSRGVNPNDALLATFSSVFDPITGDWSQAAPLNPLAKPETTTPSATAPSLQQDLVIAIAAKDWSDSLWTSSGSEPAPFNPGGDQLRSITIELTPDQGGAVVTRQLSPQQVLIGANTTLASLQAQANNSDLNYTFLSNQPALNLLISRQAKNAGDVNNLDLTKTYTATVHINVTDPAQITPTPEVVTRKITGFNTTGAQVFSAIDGNGADAKALKTKFSERREKTLATAAVIQAAPLQLKYIDSGVVLNSASSVAAANSPATPSPATSFGQSQAYGWFKTSTDSTDSKDHTYSGWLAIAQTNSANAISNPAGRVWIQYTGNFISSNAETETHTEVTDAEKAPKTWLNALANSNFSPEAPNRPLLNDKTNPAPYGGLLIQADATTGWGQNFGQTMLVVDVNDDGTDDLVISAPSANAGGKVVIIDGAWIQDNLTNPSGSTILNLANRDNSGPHVLVLSPDEASAENEDSSQSAFGWALAFDSVSQTLYIGAPNYSRKVGPDLESVPIGAIYQYKSASKTFESGNRFILEPPTLGIAGRTDTNDLGGPASNYWGARLGASLAVSDTGDLAIGAPGVQASLLYSGTEAVNQLVAGNKNPSAPYGQGALLKVMLPTPLTNADGLDVYVRSDGTDNRALADVIRNNTSDKKSDLANEESTYMQSLKNFVTKEIAKANEVNNSAIQTGAVGSVYLIDSAKGLAPGKTLNASQASATFYGPSAWNTIGDTDFGASLAFADISNTNSKSVLAVGAPSTGGPGSVYLINTSQPFDQPGSPPSWIENTNLGTTSLGSNQYLAYLTSDLTLYGAEDLDQFGSGLVSLGDTNGDGYEDLLIQAPNASAGAGNGYVVFGNDQLIQSLNTNSGTNSSGETLLSGHNPAVGSVKPGSISQLVFADGSPLTIPILSEMGHGVSAATGQGSFGAGDVDADGNNDILLGSGTNGQAYITKGQDYLAAIDNLQLQKLASNNGYLLEGLATTNQGSLRSIGDFNGDGYGDFLSILPGALTDTVRIELGANTQEILADYLYNFYSFNVAPGTQVLPGGDINGDGFSDIALFLDQNLSSAAEGNAGAGSTTGILYGRPSDQLPLGSGFGLIAPVDASSTPLAPLPGQGVAGGLTDADPSVIAVGNTLYAAVKGVGSGDTTIWFTQSTDGGNSWKDWTNLSSFNPGFATNTGPSLAFFQDRLYLGFSNTSGTLSVSSWDPNSNNPLAWGEPRALSSSIDPAAIFRSVYSPKLVDRGDSLDVVWVDAGSGTIHAASSTAPASGAFNSDSWTPPILVQERVDTNGVISFQPIVATAAPTASLLGGTPVLGVNNNGTINIYAANSSGKTVSLTSSFPPGSGGPAGTTSPGITTTNTGLALSYANADGSISLQRLNLLQLDGTPVDGLVINGDGSIDTSNANLQWQGVDLAATGLTSALATVPLSVNGTLLLANVRNSASQNSQIWLDAIPNASDPASTTWLNTTVQLGSILSQRAGSENSIGSGLAAGPWQQVGTSVGAAKSQASLTRNGDTVYMAVRGTDDHLYWNSSSDNGKTWNAWQGLDQRMGTFTAPSIAYFNNTLYLCYVAAGSNELNVTYLKTGNTWASQYQIPGQKATAASMIAEGDNLAVYFIANDDSSRLLKSYSSSPSGTSWTGTSVLYSPDANQTANQTASSNLALTRYNGQTYLAYQGSTYGSPSNTIYLTTASDTVANDGGSQIWTLLNTPAGTNPVLKRGVGLTSGNDGLVLTYTDNSQPSQVAVQLSDSDVRGWQAVTDGQSLSSSLGFTPLVTADASNPLLIAGMDSDLKIKAQLNALNLQILNSAQTGSSLSALGDINSDGFDDLAISANNVAYAPSGNFRGTDAQLTTGVRVVLGAPTATAISSINNANASVQAVQIANLYRQPNVSTSANSVTPVANLSGPAKLNLSGGQDGLLVQITSPAPGSTISNTSLIASASNSSSLNKLFDGATARTTSSPTWSGEQGSGSPSLYTQGGFGDLNADGYIDYLDEIPTTVYGPGGMSWSVWSIRAAGDANGNGVDDVLLSLAPQGPAYGQVTAGQPSALQSVLVDGSLFSVDRTTNTFRLDQLRTPLNPYNRSQLYNLNSEDPSAYAPNLQNWFEPILSYKAGDLTSASTQNTTIPNSAQSYTAPAAAVTDNGQAYLVFSGKNLASSGAGLWMAYQNSSGNWTQSQLPIGNDASYLSPSAVFYKGNLVVAYTDVDRNLNVAWCEGDPGVSGAVWNSYQVIAESSQWNPTLVVEQGRLALYFPSNAGGTRQQTIRYLYSTDPLDKSANGNWGASPSSTGDGYSDISGTLRDTGGSNLEITSPIAATTYQGRTVLAFRGYNRKLEDANIWLATQIEIEDASTATVPGRKLSWVGFDTNLSDTNGVGLTSDQSTLYLTSTTSAYGTLYQNPQPQMWSLNPKEDSDGNWVIDNMQTVSGPGYLPQTALQDNPLSTNKYNNGYGGAEMKISTALVPYLANGRLYATWSGSTGTNPGLNATDVEVADLSVTLNPATQKSLAGYSIDGNIDINGDGLMDMLVSDPSDPSQSIDNQYALFGGDYLNIASHVGTSGDDILLGTPLADVIYTIQGADQVTSQGGADVIYTGAGDDSISIQNNAFIRIDAGSGFDVLRLEGQAYQNYDFRLNLDKPEYFVGTKLRDIELINSADYGANVLSFDAAAINAINPDRVLFVTPDAADSITLTTEFNRNAGFDTSYGGTLWSAYAASPANTPSASSNPSLLYVATPTGQDTDWLGSHVSIGVQALGASRSTAASEPTLPTSSPVAGSSTFGDGLTLTAYRTSPNSGFVRFTISRTEVGSSQLISYVSTSSNSSSQPGLHYTPVAGLLRLDVGQAQADITVPINAAEMVALRNGTLSMQVAELDDIGQKQLHLLLEVDHASNGSRPTLSGLNLQFDEASQTASIGFRADINKAARAEGLASTLNLNVLRRQSANSSTADLKNRAQKLVLSEGLLAKFDRDGSDNGQVELQFDLNAATGSILLQPAIQGVKPLVLSKLDPSRKPITLGIDLTTTSLDSLLLDTPPKGVVLNKTAVDFTVKADADGKAKIFLDLTQVGNDLEITETKDGAKTTRKPNHQLLYYGIDADGALSDLTYNALRRTGARFYDTDGDEIADFVSLTFEDGGMGDTGPSGDGLIHDPSVGGFSNLTDVEWAAIDSRTLQAASKTNKDAPAALVVKANLNSRSTSANQIYYVVHDPSDSLSFDSIFADLDLLKARSQTLYTSLESTDVTLASVTSLTREILLINGHYVRFFEVVDGNLNQLSSPNDARLRVLSTTGFSGDSRSVNAFSSSGVSISLALVDGDQGLNALIGQEQDLAAVLDFTSFTPDQKVEGSLSLAREAAFDAVTGFYRTLDIKGTVWLDPSDKAKGTIAPGQAGTTAADYGAAALRNMVDSLTGMKVGNRQTSSSLITLQESTYLAPIAQVNGHTFVSFEKGNTDGISHFVTLGTNTFGLEDLHGGGDRDYDDQVISFVFGKLVNPVV